MLKQWYVREYAIEIRKSLEKRNMNISLIEQFLKSDIDWRKLKGEVDELRAQKNRITAEITKISKNNGNIKNLVAESKCISQKIASKEEEMESIYKNNIEFLLYLLPDKFIVNVPDGKDAKDNKELRKWGKPSKIKPLKSHIEIAEELNLADFEQGRKYAGQGFNYLLNELVLLDRALQQYALDFLMKKDFKIVSPPLILQHHGFSRIVDIEDTFKNVVYSIKDEDKICDKCNSLLGRVLEHARMFYRCPKCGYEPNEGYLFEFDQFLIPTAEHPLVLLFGDKVLNLKDLPIKVCACTPCFRKEIGSRGVDTKGLFRMHQFNKVEQVVVCHPSESFKIMEEMQKITEEFFKSLEIPYRVIEICAGDMNQKVIKQYDIEAWFPRRQEYAEVTSASNCSYYQSMGIDIGFINEEGKKEHTHTLNNTMVATSRAMVAILENFQQKDGSVLIPKVLHKYTKFKKIGGAKKSGKRRRAG